LLDQETGVELQRLGRAELPPDPPAERHADAEIAAVQQQAFAHLDFVLVAVQHAEIEDQQREHDGQECQPEPVGCTEERGRQKRMQSCHEPSLYVCLSQEINLVTPTSR